MESIHEASAGIVDVEVAIHISPLRHRRGDVFAVVGTDIVMTLGADWVGTPDFDTNNDQSVLRHGAKRKRCVISTNAQST